MEQLFYLLADTNARNLGMRSRHLVS